MKPYYLIIVLCTLASYSYCQSFNLNDPNTIFKDSVGNVLSSSQVIEMGMKSLLSLYKVEGENGKTIVVVKTSPKTQATRGESEWEKKWKGASLPDFELTDLKGVTLNERDLKGKVIVLNFWFTRCGPCVAEIPELNKLVEKYKDKNVIFLAPGLDSKEEISKFLQKNPFSYQILPTAESFSKSLEIQSYPVNAVVNQSGVITELISGASTTLFERLDNQISALVKK